RLGPCGGASGRSTSVDLLGFMRRHRTTAFGDERFRNASWGRTAEGARASADGAGRSDHSISCRTLCLATWIGTSPRCSHGWWNETFKRVPVCTWTNARETAKLRRRPAAPPWIGTRWDDRRPTRAERASRFDSTRGCRYAPALQSSADTFRV